MGAGSGSGSGGLTRGLHVSSHAACRKRIERSSVGWDRTSTRLHACVMFASATHVMWPAAGRALPRQAMDPCMWQQ